MSKQGIWWETHHPFCQAWRWISDVLEVFQMHWHGKFCQNWWQVEYTPDIIKYWKPVCIHQPRSCTWDALRLSNTATIQSTRPRRPSVATKEKKERSQRRDYSLLTSMWLRHFGVFTNMQFMQDNLRIYETWRLFTRMGSCRAWKNTRSCLQL